MGHWEQKLETVRAEHETELEGWSTNHLWQLLQHFNIISAHAPRKTVQWKTLKSCPSWFLTNQPHILPDCTVPRLDRQLTSVASWLLDQVPKTEEFKLILVEAHLLLDLTASSQKFGRSSSINPAISLSSSRSPSGSRITWQVESRWVSTHNTSFGMVRTPRASRPYTSSSEIRTPF